MPVCTAIGSGLDRMHFAWNKFQSSLIMSALWLCKIPCSCGKFYTGETRRRPEANMKEHQDACREKGLLKKSAAAEYA